MSENTLTEEELIEYKRLGELESEIRRQKSKIRDKILQHVRPGDELILGQTRVAIKEIPSIRMKSASELKDIISPEQFIAWTNSTVSHRVDIKPSL